MPLVTTVYSNIIRIAEIVGCLLHYKATVDSGSPDLDLYLQQGPGLPTTEGSAGDSADGWIDIGGKIADVTDQLWHALTLSPVTLPYLRIKAIGQGTNPASSRLLLKLGVQEELD